MPSFTSLFGGAQFEDANPNPGKMRLSTLMNNFIRHESTESDAERALEGGEKPWDESFLDNFGSVRAEEHLARREAQNAILDGSLDPSSTDYAKQKLQSLIEGWSWQPPQKADEQGEMEAMGIVPNVQAKDEEMMKAIQTDPKKVLGMVLECLMSMKQ